jgi:hypothetical protein
VVFFQDESGHEERAIWWRSAGHLLPDLCDLVYTLQRDTYQGKARLQLHVVRMEPLGLSAGAPLIGSQFRIVDRRAAAGAAAGAANGTATGTAAGMAAGTAIDRAQELQRVLSENGAANVQVWDELAGLPDAGLPGMAIPLGCEPLMRLQLEQKSILVIWSAPAGPEELAAALRRVEPQAVVLLTPPNPPGGDKPDSVMQRVNGMIRTAQQRGDALDDPSVIARMAARIGQREATLRAALDYHRLLKAQDKPGAERAWRKFVYFVEETRSYRRYFQRAAAEAILRVPV